MIIDVLIQILIVVAIVAITLLIIVLWKTNIVLDDFKETSKIAKRRVKQLDSCLDGLENAINNASSVIKGFCSSLETGQKIKEKLKSLWE